jgi:hypothetical protein
MASHSDTGGRPWFCWVRLSTRIVAAPTIKAIAAQTSGFPRHHISDNDAEAGRSNFSNLRRPGLTYLPPGASPRTERGAFEVER